ncbi:MAG: sulfotransferase family protein [Planctomycetaceae bacterium]|nr:sulfotransferase family protein [Planctomycetaceae bacterium]
MNTTNTSDKTADQTYRMIERPTFLVGAERSGTTLLRLMIDHHPSIAWSREFEYAVDHIPPRGWPDLDEYYHQIEMDRVFRDYNFTIDRSLNYPQLIDSFLVQLRQRSGKRLIGATVHRHFDRLLDIWPDARFIRLLRDGRDVAVSVIGMDWASQTYTGCQRWIDAELLWQKLAAQIPESRRVDVVFEQLIRDPKASLQPVCDLLEVPYDPAMLDYPNDTTYSAPDVKIIQRWKRKLTEYQVQLAEAHIADMLVERGYELSGYPRITVPRWKQRWFRFQDRYSRAYKRFRKYGIRLYLADILSRRLNAKAWQKSVQIRRNQIPEPRLK